MNYRSALIDLGVDSQTVEKFFSWHKQNLDVWNCFERVALDLIEEGFKSYGAKAIMEVVRYKLRKNIKGELKCNNNYTSYYARIFALKHPTHDKFFEFRETKGLTT